MQDTPKVQIATSPDVAAGRHISQATIRRAAVAGGCALATIIIASFVWSQRGSIVPDAHSRAPEPTRATLASDGRFWPTAAQWSALTVEAVGSAVFSSIVTTDGRIAIDEDHTTPIFSPYAGRVLSLHVKAGDRIEAGQPLFTIAASDMVQAQNDVVSSVASLNKATSGLRLAEINLARARNLFEVKAGSQREFQAAEDARNAAVADNRVAEAALEAARNRLRLLGKTNAEIDVFQKEGRISPETVIKAPLGGTVVQRKVGPGQYVGGAQSEPVFVIGDLSKVWMVANVKENDTPAIQVGALAEFRVMALPGRTFSAKISYIASSVDTATRRVLVRAEVDNADGALKPEMFAMVDIVTSVSRDALSVPRGALVYDGENAHVWSVGTDKSIVKRRVKVGAASAGRVQIVEGVVSGDRVVSKGTLFVDRAAGSAE